MLSKCLLLLLFFYHHKQQQHYFRTAKFGKPLAISLGFALILE